MTRGRRPIAMDLPRPEALSGDVLAAPRHEIVYRALRAAILSGSLPVATCLPSSRSLAERWGLSRGTVEVAYERLAVEGYVGRRPGSATRVAAALPDSFFEASAVPRDVAAVPPSAPAPLRAARPIESPVRAGLPFVARAPDPALFDLAAWSRDLTRALKRTSGLDAPTDPRGWRPLRARIAEHLRVLRGVECEADDILLTSGIRQGLDLIARATIAPGDVVAVEDPGYAFSRSIFQMSRAKVLDIPVGRDGIDVDALRRTDGTKLVYVTPAHQSPLGTLLSVTRRLDLLAWARTRGALVVEDDYDSEFSYGTAPLPALMSLDRSDRTIFCGSFNKTLHPGLGIGFVVARGGPRDLLSAIWGAIGRAVPITEQVGLEAYLADGSFARHLRTARAAYLKRRDRLIAILDAEAPGRVRISGQDAGFHFVLWLDEHADDRAFCRDAADLDLALQPLSAFCRTVALPPAVVVGYASVPLPRIERAGRVLGRLLARSG